MSVLHPLHRKVAAVKKKGTTLESRSQSTRQLGEARLWRRWMLNKGAGLDPISNMRWREVF